MMCCIQPRVIRAWLAGRGHRAGKWHTFGVHPIERRRRSAVDALRVVARWGLLGAVIAAVLALHVLTTEHTPGQHAGIEVVSTEGHSLVPLNGSGSIAESVMAVGVDPDAAGSAAGGFDHPGGGGELLVGCVLFLVIAGPAVLSALLRGRRVAESARAATGVPVSWMQLPTRPGLPRLALCVIRI